MWVLEGYWESAVRRRWVALHHPQPRCWPRWTRPLHRRGRTGTRQLDPMSGLKKIGKGSSTYFVSVHVYTINIMHAMDMESHWNGRVVNWPMKALIKAYFIPFLSGKFKTWILICTGLLSCDLQPTRGIERTPMNNYTSGCGLSIIMWWKLHPRVHMRKGFLAAKHIFVH